MIKKEFKIIERMEENEKGTHQIEALRLDPMKRKSTFSMFNTT